MKFWKNWPYWVKGGVLGIFLYSILVLLVIVTYVPCPTYTPPIGGGGSLPNDGECFTTASKVVGIISSIVLYPVGQLFKLEIFKHQDVAQLIFPILYLFVVGAILGWLYGKIKDRKLSSLGPKA